MKEKRMVNNAEKRGMNKLLIVLVVAIIVVLILLAVFLFLAGKKENVETNKAEEVLRLINSIHEGDESACENLNSDLMKLSCKIDMNLRNNNDYCSGLESNITFYAQLNGTSYVFVSAKDECYRRLSLKNGKENCGNIANVKLKENCMGNE